MEQKTDEMKKCTRCKILKHRAGFGKDKYTPDGLNYGCLDCAKMDSRRYRKSVKGTEKYRIAKKKHSLSHLYGLPIDQYHSILSLQNELCAICKEHKSKFKRSLSVDHCHKTGKVRGLLCGNCNMGLGKFKESTEIMNFAIKYIDKWDDGIK